MLPQDEGLGSKRPRTTASLSPATPAADGADHLSSLPREMLEEILRLLPLKEAVRTSVLAEPWRFRWTNCPDLDLPFLATDPPAAVDAVLARYNCTVSQLEVAPESCGRTDGWLRSLAAKDVRKLFLTFNDPTSPSVRFPAAVPISLFSCTSLTSLFLMCCDIPPLPSPFPGFPNLLSLELEEVDFPTEGEKTIESLIAMSPALTTLCILFPTIYAADDVDDDQYDKWTIRAPNLRILGISSWRDYGWHFDGDLPHIEEASLDLVGPELPRLLPAMTQAKKLSIELTNDTTLEELPSYKNLKDLSFYILLTKYSAVESMFLVLRNAPNLEHLHIMVILHREGEITEWAGELLEEEWTVDLFSGLKTLDLYGMTGQSYEMQFIQFILSKATQIQKVEIYVPDNGFKSMETVSSELSVYKKASPHANIIIDRFVGNFPYEDTGNDEP